MAPVMSPQTGPFFENERRYAAAKWDCARREQRLPQEHRQ
jgi:hypothetical protein